MVDNFIEYLFNSILEASEGDELPIYFSDTFREILKEIEESTGNEIATRLLFEEGMSNKRVFVDIDQDSIDKVSFIMANKAEEILGRREKIKHLRTIEHDKIYKARQRGTMKINRFVNDLFKNEYQTEKLTPEQREANKEKGIKTPAQHLEDFVNQFKAIREPGEFVLVKGSEIIHWYSEDQYENGNGTLGGSCMMYEECEEYLEFYAFNKNKISMLIMKSKENEHNIVGRALVWNLDTPSGRTFMDRVYTNYDHDVENFKKYAKDHGWLYKYKQNMDASERIVDTKNDQTTSMTLVVKNISDPDSQFPYLDTLKYYSPSLDKISNEEGIVSESEYYVLEGTNGDDYEVVEVRSIEELRELFYDDIRYDVSEYAPDYIDIFWNHVNDDEFIENHKESEVNSYIEDFEHINHDTDILIKYIKDNVADIDDIPKNIDDLDVKELSDLLDELDLKEDLVTLLIDERYDGYTAKDVIEEIYGSNPSNDDIVDTLENYLDEFGFAEEVSENESEENLRDRYPNDDY